MSHKPYKGFEPKWVDTPAPADSYRSIFRWGDPEFFKYPKESLYKMMKEVFKLTDDDFKEYTDDIGFDKVDLSDHPVKLAQEHLDALREIVGDEGISTSDYDRLSVAYGFTAYDILRLRHKIIDFGAAVNPEAMYRMADILQLYDGGALDMAVLGFAEVDRFGNVNAHNFQGRVVGPGGFIDITQNAKKL